MLDAFFQGPTGTTTAPVCLAIRGTLDKMRLDRTQLLRLLRQCGASVDSAARMLDCVIPYTDTAPMRQLATLVGIPQEIRDVMGRLLDQTSEVSEAPAVSPLFTGVLQGYQLKALAFCRARSRRMLALDMGLGKTVIGIAFLVDALPALVVIPASVRDSWLTHVEKFAPTVTVLDETLRCLYDGDAQRRPMKTRRRRTTTDPTPPMIPEPYPSWVPETRFVVLCTYAKLARLQPSTEIQYVGPDGQTREGCLVSRPSFGVVIADEAHYLKNKDSRRAAAFRRIQGQVPRTVMLTGTPAQKHCDVYNLLCLLDHERFRLFFHYRHPPKTPHRSIREVPLPVNQRQLLEMVGTVPVAPVPIFYFAERYCQPEEVYLVGRTTGFKFGKNRNAAELGLVCRHYMLRMVKSEVVTLPALTRLAIAVDTVDIQEKAFYAAEWLRIEDVRSTRGALYADAALMALCRTTARRKVATVCSYLHTEFGRMAATALSTGNPHEKCILFFHHREIGSAYRAWLDNRQAEYVYIDGTTPHAKRTEAIERWTQDPNCPLGLLSLCATSTGLNLQFCTRVYLVGTSHTIRGTGLSHRTDVPRVHCILVARREYR
jgi:hypothetical protein